MAATVPPVNICEGSVVMSLVASVCLSVMLQLLKALTRNVHFWYVGTSLENLSQVSISRSSGQACM